VANAASLGERQLHRPHPRAAGSKRGKLF